jgi:hypothetical protein
VWSVSPRPRQPSGYSTSPVYSLRLPPDLSAGVEDLAERNNLPRGEVIRELIRMSVGNPDGAQAYLEGYNAGRALGTRMLHLLVTKAVRTLPSTPQEAVALMAELSAQYTEGSEG